MRVESKDRKLLAVGTPFFLVSSEPQVGVLLRKEKGKFTAMVTG
jgi:hypothetical protein